MACTHTHAVASRVTDRNPEQRMLKRSVTYVKVAAYLCQLWDPRALPPPAREPAAPSPSLQRSQRLAALTATVRHNHCVFAASFAPRVTFADLHAPAGESQRHLLVVPVATRGGILVHVPRNGLFGVAAKCGAPLRDQAIHSAQFLSGASPPFLAGYTRDASAHAIFALPSIVQPEEVARTPGELASIWQTGATSAWCTAAALGDGTAYELALLAVSRLRAAVEAVTEDPLRVGACTSLSLWCHTNWREHGARRRRTAQLE